MRRRRVRRVSAAAMAGLLVLGAPPPGATRNGIVAVVNDEVITEGDLVMQMSSLLRDEAMPAPSADRQDEVRAMLLERLIDQRLIVQDAKRKGLSVPSADVAERLRALRSRLGSREAFDAMLRESGLNEEQLRTKVREQLLAQKAIDQEVRAKIVLSPGDVAQAAAKLPAAGPPGGEEVETRHLLVRITPERPAAQAMALAQDLHQRLVKGEAFATLAKDYSDDPHAQDGGLLGWIGPGELLPELDAALFGLKPEEVSAPIQTRIGVHLLKAGGRRPLSDEQQGSAQDQVEARLYQQKFGELLQAWLEELREQAYIQIVGSERAHR